MKIIGKEIRKNTKFLEFRKKSPFPQLNCPNNLGQLKSVLIYFLILVIGHNESNQSHLLFILKKMTLYRLSGLAHILLPALSFSSGCLGSCQWIQEWGLFMQHFCYNGGNENGIWKKQSWESPSLLSGFCFCVFHARSNLSNLVGQEWSGHVKIGWCHL